LENIVRTNVIVTDDFYSNPDAVREFALSQPFDVTGNYPGRRTKSFLTEDTKQAIQSIIYQAAGNVTDWMDKDGLTGSFQIAFASDRTWIHADYYNSWAAVCYLTPNAPLSGGTGLFRHKATGDFFKKNSDHEAYDYTKWEMVDRIGNVYNRLILYRGSIFHASLDYFGSDMSDGRLFQVFFFNTER
jgi:predicted Zn-dependent protease with MMP-like domain